MKAHLTSVLLTHVTPDDFHNYHMWRNKAKQVIREAKMDHESLIISDFKFNLKWLHKYIRQKQKVKYSIGPLKKPDRSTTTTSQESAEALACFFKPVFIHEDLQELPDFPSRVSDTIPDLVINLLKSWYIINFQNSIPSSYRH